MKRRAMNMSTRLAIAFGSLIVLMVVNSIVGYFSIHYLDAKIALLLDDRYPKTVWTNQIIGGIHRISRSMRDAVLLSDPAAVRREIDAVEAERKQIDQRFAQLAASISEVDGKAALQNALDFRDLYSQGQEEFLRMVGLGLKSQATDYLVSTVGPQQQGYIDAVESLTRVEGELMIQSGRDSAVLAARSSRLVGVLGLGALAFAVVTAVSILRYLRRLLGGEPKYAADAVRRIADGDLTSEIDVRGGDGASLVAALAQMQEALRRIVAEVQVGVQSVSSASVQIARGNEDLAHRTEQQASSLQQTAASMEQITGTVNQSAENARQARELATCASTAADRGGEVVGRVVSTMDEISASSRRIAEIVNVIDSIAFQTNILALNAAVEAARAGEQGRGFAVVASEVRNLAQRASQAAREIKEIISESVGKVESGSQLVNDAGASMSEIVTQVRRVSQLIGEIAHAAVEQSSGIRQVGQAVAHMDTSTQQNATLVDQSTAAAEQLTQQAERLERAIAVFRVRGAPPLAAA